MRYIRYKCQKQQINYLNCNKIDQWIDTCQTRLSGFDSICSGSCNCTTYGNDESEVIYSYKKLNPNYSYDCLDGNRYYKLQKQVSYDGGLTYIDMDEYKTGNLYESNSPFCSAETVLMDWFESDNYCVGTDLYKREVKRVSFDGGNTWSDMGYTDENGVTTYEYRSTKIESDSCNCIIINDTLSFEFTSDTTTYNLNDTTYTATSSPYSITLTELGIETLTSCKNTFRGSSITKLVSFLDTSNVSDMSYMFYLCGGLTSLNVSSLDTSNVRDMSLMFADCGGLTSLDVSNFNTSACTNMSYMFTNCIRLTNLDLSNFNTSNVTVMRDMFRSCISLTNLDLSNFDTSNVTNMINIFSYCSGLTSLNVSSWDVSKVTTYYDDMFKGCTSLNRLILGNVTQSTYDWWCERLSAASISCNIIECTIISEPDVTNNTLSFEFTGDTMTYYLNSTIYTATSSPYTITLDELGIETLTGCGATFRFSNITNLISFPDTSNVTEMSEMFFRCSGLTSLDLSSFDTSNVTSMRYMFQDCSSLTSLDLSSFDTSNVTSMSYMFQYCSGLTSLDVSSFNTSNVTSMNAMFYNCSGLTSLDVSSFNTTNVTDMSYMFYGCSGLTSLDVSSFNTTNVTDMGTMFQHCGSLTSLDLSNFVTSNVTTMSYMFTRCSGLTSLDLSSFNTSNVTSITYMFYNCSSLISLDVSSFDTTYIRSYSDLFTNCSSLRTLKVKSGTRNWWYTRLKNASIQNQVTIIEV